MKFEDFSPFNSTDALVAHGDSYNHLDKISMVQYKIEKEIKFLKFKELVRGTYLRLGNYFKGKLTYSDNYTVFEDGKFLFDGIQPYTFYKGTLYQHHGVIFLNNEIIIKPQTNYIVVGRPTFYNGFVFYETRIENAPNWETWKYDLKDNTHTPVLFGANAFVYNDTIFYSKWNKKEFELCHKKI